MFTIYQVQTFNVDIMFVLPQSDKYCFNVIDTCCDNVFLVY